MKNRNQIILIVLAAVGMISAELARADALVASDSKLKIAPVALLKLQAFSLKDVRLLDGPFHDAMELDKAYLLSLDADRLLHTFRLTAGRPTSAQPYGGWESPQGEVRGHSLGHYLSACSLMYASTGDEKLKARVDGIVAELAKCQAALPAKGYNPGFLSAYPEEFFDRVDACKPVWAPYYTLHKIMAGLLDAHLQCDNSQALEVLNKMAGWLKFRIGRLSRQQQQKALGNEHGGMNEVLANLYSISGNPDHLRLAQDFNHEAIFEPLAHGLDKLDGKHANTQIPKITGAVRQFELTGDKSLLAVASTFWRAVARNRSYCIGGHSDGEHFFPIADFAKHLSPVTCETCNTYNLLKLTRHLFAIEPSAELMDFYERALYNQILASIEPQKGMVTYFVPLKPGHFKVYSTPDNSFWCCTGTGMENHAKYADTIYFHDQCSLYVNLFIPSELNWKAKGLMVRQETQFPEADSTRLTFHCPKPCSLALKIRWPAWAEKGIQVTVNGTQTKVDGKPGSYVGIQRAWRDGDVVEVRLPLSLRTEPLPGNNARIVAIFHGPIVLAGELGGQGLEKINFWTHDQCDLVGVPTPRIPQMVCEPNELVAKLAAVPGKPLTYQTHGIGRPAEVTLSPLYKLHYQRYAVYWKLLSESDWKEHAAQLAADEAACKSSDPDSKRVKIQVDPKTVVSPIASDFIGLGYETSAVAQANYFGAKNNTLIQLCRNLSPHGLIRVGGNISDHTKYVPDGTPAVRSEKEVTIINRANLVDLGEFARATGWKVMWGLNLFSGSKAEAVQEAIAVNAALGSSLQSFEIGNEVDLHLKTYDAFSSAYRDYKSAIRSTLPDAQFSGPDAAARPAWVAAFARTEAKDAKLLTHHYYRGYAGNRNATIETLLAHDDHWDARLEELRQVSRDQRIDYRINEVNSFSGGGKAGVSDTFASALWSLDYMFVLASHGCAGINLETDINQHAWISHYSPIVHDAAGHCSARPDYYGMLAFAMAGNGDLLKLTLDKGRINLSAYASKDKQDYLWITVVNKDLSQDADLEASLPAGYGTVAAFWLKAPSLESKERVTLAGAEVSAGGKWTAGLAEKVAVKNGSARLPVPHASAVLLRLAQ